MNHIFEAEKNSLDNLTPNHVIFGFQVNIYLGCPNSGFERTSVSVGYRVHRSHLPRILWRGVTGSYAGVGGD